LLPWYREGEKEEQKKEEEEQEEQTEEEEEERCPHTPSPGPSLLQ
jgi:hypothetical protein